MPAISAESGASQLDRALAAAAAEPLRIGEVLAELKAGRVWIPLPRPDDAGAAPGTVVPGTVAPDGSVRLPTVTYQGYEFVPAFTSAARMRQSRGGGADAEIPHLVVSAAALARLLPARLGIAVNPNAGPSVALSPYGVCELARSDVEAHRA